MLKLGRKPELLRLLVVPGEPFVVELEIEDGTPFDEAPLLEFSAGPHWLSEIAGPIASFSIPVEQVDSTLAAIGADRKVSLTLAGRDWAQGLVETID